MNKNHTSIPIVHGRPLIEVSAAPASGTRCVQLQIPDDDNALRQLVGVMGALQHWKSYKRDDAHLGTLWARAWRAAMVASMPMEGCMSIQFQQDLCGLSVSFDGGETWEAIYDGMDCLTSQGAQEFFDGLIDSRIQDWIDDGILQRGTGEQSPQAPPTPGQCEQYSVRLAPGSKWLCPQPVKEGDTVYIDNIAGGWSIGELAWYCPTGARYLVGACSNDLKTHVDGDPLNPGAYHMALIGKVGATYFDPITSVYTIGAGVPDSDLFIMANTNLTGVPDGEAQFDVTVCRGGWTHVFDFSLGALGWVKTAGGVWQNARWESEFTTLLSPRIAIGVNTTLKSVRVVGHAGAANNGGARGVWTNTGKKGDLPTGAGDFDTTMQMTVVNPTYLQFNVDCNNVATLNYVTLVVVTGQGADPWL